MPSVIVRMRARLLFLPAVLTLLVSIHILLLVRLPTNGTASKSSSRVLVPLDTRSYEEQRPEITISNHHPQHQGVIDVHNISSVDYMACCGAGHRISKTAEAHYLSLQLGFALRSFWGFCDTSHPKEGQTEVFHHLFGPQPVHAIVSNTSYHQYARTNNDVPGFFKLIRDGSCASCNLNKAAADVSFYRDLRDRFRLQSVVDAFRARHFSGKTVVGMHIRAGNGERGDFKIRGRGIGNMTKWLDSLTDQLLAAAKNQKWGDAVLFLATDTPSVIDNVRKLLSKENELMAVDVVSVDQFRPAEGSGVLFGVQGKIERQNELCLQGWENTIMDMMLLSHADVLIAARPSSFTQSLPMQIVLATDEANRVVAHPYCEVNPDATEMRCYSDFADWCCRGRTVFSLQGIQRYDYLRMPHPSTSTLDIADSETRRRLKIRNRPDGGCIPLPAGRKQICLPYDWSEVVVKARTPKTSPPPLSPLRAGRIRNRKERRTKNEEDTRNEEVKSNSILISEYRILELPPPVIFVALQGTDNLSP